MTTTTGRHADMSADTLRRAAEVMRSKAEWANEGPWRAHWGRDSVHADLRAHPDGGAPFGLSSDLVPPDAEHIASWHPPVAVAVADWLNVVEAWLDEFGGMPAESVGEMHIVAKYALAVANAYLRETP